MRFTRIYLRRFSQVAVLGSGLAFGAFAGAYFSQPDSVETPQPVAQVDPLPEPETQTIEQNDTPDKDAPPTLAETFAGFVVDGVARNASGEVIYASIASNEKRYNVEGLRAQGYLVKMVNSCEVLIMNRERTETVRLYTTYCGPEKPPVTPPQMSPEERYKWKLEQVRAIERLAQK